MPDTEEKIINKKKSAKKSIDPKALSEALRRNLKRRKAASKNTDNTTEISEDMS